MLGQLQEEHREKGGFLNTWISFPVTHESQIISVVDRISESRELSYIEQIREMLLEETLPVLFLTPKRFM